MSIGISVGQARTCAAYLHSEQTDKAGEPYSTHLQAVADGVRILGGGEDEQIAAYFHDSVEDGHATIEELVRLGLSEASIRIVEAMTKRPGEQRSEYLERIIEAGPQAMRVKVADLLHNSRHDRLASLPQGTADRLRAKYRPELARLLSELGLTA